MTRLAFTLVARHLVGLASRWAFAPDDWTRRRRRTELLLSFTPPVRGVALSRVELGGVPADRLAPVETRNDLTILFLHGGGYAVGSARGHRRLAASLARRVHATTYVLDYRLAPEHPHPAALEDASAAYETLVGVGQNVAVVGDSAGGGLALVLGVACRDRGLTAPVALGLLYPWLDLTEEEMNRLPRARREPVLTRQILEEFAQAYAAPELRVAPSISPLRADLAGLPPVVMDGCSDDLIVGHARRLVTELRAVGGHVHHRELPRSFHAFHTLTPWVPEAARAVECFADRLAASTAGAGEVAR